LCGLLEQYKGSCIVHVGAGLSTAAGIPDFRGKNGVWTKKLRNTQSNSTSHSLNDLDDQIDTKVPQIATVKKETDDDKKDLIKPFDETVPTFSHLALGELCRQGYVGYIISQNVDGLFLKSNLERKYISELHGNFYLDECTICRSRFIRSTASESMRLQKSHRRCPRGDGLSGKPCKGFLRDTILDWESPIPHNELRLAQREAKRCKLHLCIGTSMQLRPSKDLVCNPERNKHSKLVVINLQPTQLDTRANLVINFYADEIFRRLVGELALEVSPYRADEDPTKVPDRIGTMWRRS